MCRPMHDVMGIVSVYDDLSGLPSRAMYRALIGEAGYDAPLWYVTCKFTVSVSCCQHLQRVRVWAMQHCCNGHSITSSSSHDVSVSSPYNSNRHNS